MIILVYSGILLVLSIIIGKSRGLRGIISLLFNFLIIVLSLILINFGFNIYIISYLAFFTISSIIIFYLNGYNVKTKSAYIGVIVVTIILNLIIYYLNYKLHIGSFSYEFTDEISAYSFNIDLKLEQIVFMVLLYICVGSICDTSIAISSALYEINNNANLTKKELFASSMNVGKDIIGTTVNTLVFSFVAGFIGYILWHNYDSLLELINYSGFVSEVVELICAIIGCLLIIPITSLIEIKFLKNNNFKKNKNRLQS